MKRTNILGNTEKERSRKKTPRGLVEVGVASKAHTSNTYKELSLRMFSCWGNFGVRQKNVLLDIQRPKSHLSYSHRTAYIVWLKLRNKARLWICLCSLMQDKRKKLYLRSTWRLEVWLTTGWLRCPTQTSVKWRRTDPPLCRRLFPAAPLWNRIPVRCARASSSATG